MPGWIRDLLFGGTPFTMAKALWEWIMGIVQVLLGMSPGEYSPGAWNYITEQIYPYFLGAAAAFMNIFALINFCRQASDLKDTATLENWLGIFIRVAVANTVLVNGLYLIGDFVKFFNRVAGDILGSEIPAIYGDDLDLGFSLFMSLLGPIYLIVTAICSITILMEVMHRFLRLYITIATAPLAIVTVIGGRGFDGTAAAWFKTFLNTAGQVVIIALILQLSGHMVNSSVFSGSPQGWFDGAGNVFLSIITMVFVSASVKESDTFLKRAFNL